MGATSEATPIVVSSVLEIPGSLREEFEADLTDAISGFEQSFVWNGRRIACEINLRASRLTTSKSFFGDVGARVYPRCGQTLMIAGAKYQITRKGNASIKAVTGGFVEDPAFIDEPTNPALEIEYAHFITR
jgi:hypothetical protein